MRKRSWSKSHNVRLTSRAADMRTGPSPPEAVLWAALVNRKLEGVAFRRQVVLAGYICDFGAASHKLVVEVDGRQHERRVAADARRDRALERLGYRVLRIPAQVVMRELEVALGRVREALRKAAE